MEASRVMIVTPGKLPETDPDKADQGHGEGEECATSKRPSLTRHLFSGADLTDRAQRQTRDQRR